MAWSCFMQCDCSHDISGDRFQVVHVDIKCTFSSSVNGSFWKIGYKGRSTLVLILPKIVTRIVYIIFKAKLSISNFLWKNISSNWKEFCIVYIERKQSFANFFFHNFLGKVKFGLCEKIKTVRRHLLYKTVMKWIQVEHYLCLNDLYPWDAELLHKQNRWEFLVQKL